MDEKQASSSWDDLIRQVGAAPAPDALERKRPAIETPVESRKAPVPVSKPKPGDWNALASELGLEVPPESPALPAGSPDRATRTEVPPARPADLEAGFATIEPMESIFEEIIEEEISDIEFAEAEDSDDDLGDDMGDDLDDESEDSSALSGEAARSAFEALFQAGSFSAMESYDRPTPTPREPTRREPTGRDSVGREPSAREPPARESGRRETGRREAARPDVPRSEPRRQSRPAGPRGDDARRRSDDEDRPTEREGEGEDRPRRRRRRRGRGRGGAVREGAGAGGPVSSEPAQDDEHALGEGWPESPDEDTDAGDERRTDSDRDRNEDRGERPPRRRSRSRPRREESSDDRTSRAVRPARNGATPRVRDERQDHDDEDDDLAAGMPPDDSDLADADDDEPGAHSSHKSIPSWAEAIEVMVETNMQARKSTPSRSGPPRGRGRGGRRPPRKS